MTGTESSRSVFGDDVVRQALETVMPVIASTLVEALGTDSCAFYVYNQSATRTIAAFRYGFSQVVFPALSDNDELSPHSVPIESELLRTRKTIRRFTEDDFRRWPMHNEVLRERARRYSDIAVPLVWDDDVLGVAYLWRRGSTTPFNDDEIAIAEDLAQIAALAVVFARQYGRERSLRERLDALLDVAMVAGSAMTVEEILQHVAKSVRLSSGADVCNLFVFDENGEYVTEKFSEGTETEELGAFSESDQYPVNDIPVERRIRKTLQAEVVTDFERSLASGSKAVAYAREFGIRQILVVPIVYQREAIGVIYAWYRDPRQSFSNDAIQTVQAIANQTGGVIVRARLDQASRQHIQETEALLRIGRAVLTNDSLDAVLDEVANALAESIPYDYAYVALLSETGCSATISYAWGPFPSTVMNQTLPLDGSLTGWAIQAGELVNVSDAHADSRSFQFKPEYIPIKSAMVAPLKTEHGRIGALYVARRSPGGFNARQERLMSLLTQQAAVAIERTAARESLTRSAQRQTLLATVTDRLASATELRVGLGDIARSAAGVLAEGVAISLASWEYGTVSWAASAMADPRRSIRLAELLQRLDLSPYRDRVEAFLLRETSLSVQVDESPRLERDSAEAARELGIASVLIVPMRSQGRAPGLLCLLSSEAKGAFPPEVRETAELMAGRIGDELERRQMSANRAALLRTSEGMNRRSDMDELMPLIARELYEIIPYDAMYIGELDRTQDVTRPLYFVNPLGHPAEDVELASNDGLSGSAMRNQVPLLDNQAHLHPSTVYASPAEAAYYAMHGESVMAAPLIAQDLVVGVLFMSRTGEQRFNTSDFETFKLFAGLSASAIHRAMLIQRNHSIFRASVEVLAAVVDARDPAMLQHSRNVARYSRACAEMLGLEPECVERVELGGLLHDVGKLALPDEELHVSQNADPGDQGRLTQHPSRGEAILAQHPSLNNLAPLIRHCHEYYDDPGSSCRLGEDDVPLGARIIGVADVFDWVVNAQSGMGGDTVAAALDVLEQGAGTRFHPEVARVFVHAIQSGQIDLAAARLSALASAALQTVASVEPVGESENRPRLSAGME